MAPISSEPISDDRVIAFLAIRSRRELAEWLRVSDAQLRFLLYGRQSKSRYTKVQIPKRNGGIREIEVPVPFLKGLQRKVASAVGAISRPTKIALGYVRGRSIVDHAALHAKRRWVVTADIENFFPSIHFGRVRGLFLAPPFEFPDEVATVLSQICCSENSIPQGAPTSPVLSNLICKSLDRALLEFSDPLKLTVSRYSDDICFSTNLRGLPQRLAYKENGRFHLGEGLRLLLNKYGFALNERKFQVRHESERQMVTGLVVNAGAQMPRRWRREGRSICHLIQSVGDEAAAEAIFTWRRKRVAKKPASGRVILKGRTSFHAELDKKSGKSYGSALLRSYPRLSESIVSTWNLAPIHLITEGKTDLRFIRCAYSRLRERGMFAGLNLEFSDRPASESGFGGDSLHRFLREIVSYNVTKFTVGLFDYDDSTIIRKLKLEPGVARPLTVNHAFVYSACLPRPESCAEEYFCIEHFFPEEFRGRELEDGRRLFGISEFEVNSGFHVSGGYYRTNPKSDTRIVDANVFRVADGSSVALPKAEFCEKVCNGEPPFENADWDSFIPLFEMLVDISKNQGVSRLR